MPDPFIHTSHAPGCQIRQAVPEGFPWPTLSCNCSTIQDCRNCEDIDPGGIHSLDEFCSRDKCDSGCGYIAPHPAHACKTTKAGEA